MPFNEIDMQLFTPVALLKPESSSHTISKGTLPFSNKTWFCKEVADPLRARYEVLSQEFYRLMNPKQPQTFLGKDHSTNTYYILSEAVAGFKFIPTNKKIRLTKGIYSGLGQILVLAIFLHEIDLNLGNLGIDEHNEIIKIDGDWSFASLVRPDLLTDKPAQITSNLLNSLPRLTSDYFSYNWLDICYQGEKERESSDLFAEELRESPTFRLEIHQTILFILLLSPEYLQKFVGCYVSENCGDILVFLLSRQAQLQSSAMQDRQFLEFLSSEEAYVIGRNHLQRLFNFTIDKCPLLQTVEEQEALKQHFYIVWDNLKEGLQSLGPQVFSSTPVSNIDTDFESISNSSSFVAGHHPDRFFSSTPTSQRNSSSNTLKYNRTLSDLSQYLENNF